MRIVYFCYLSGVGHAMRFIPNRDPNIPLRCNESVWLVPGTFTGDE